MKITRIRRYDQGEKIFRTEEQLELILPEEVLDELTWQDGTLLEFEKTDGQIRLTSQEDPQLDQQVRAEALMEPVHGDQDG